MIAGMSGKLPESENLQEFWANLIGGVDMVTDDDRRWKAGECPLRSGVNCQGISWIQCSPLEIPVVVRLRASQKKKDR